LNVVANFRGRSAISFEPAKAVTLGGIYRGACAIIDGGARCWGANDGGQLGDGTTTQSLAPVQVKGLTSGVTDVSMGWGYACAIKDGEAWCWGGTNKEPTRVPSFPE